MISSERCSFLPIWLHIDIKSPKCRRWTDGIAIYLYIRLGETYEVKGDNINALQNYTKVKSLFFDRYGENHEVLAEIQTKIDSITVT